MKVKKRKFKLGDTEKKILVAIGLGTFVISSLALPNLPVAINSIVKLRGNKWLQNTLKNIKKKGLINLGGEEIKLTAKGKKMLREIEISDLHLTKPKEWDGIWHLVAYDIPEKYKKSRDFFRYILLRNGFFQIQESLWVHPYQCREEIAVLAKNINLTSYVILMETKKLSNEKDMQDRFGLFELEE